MADSQAFLTSTLTGILWGKVKRLVTEKVAENSIPSGTILMWSGGLNQIPSGWVLCDGTKNTPDLRGKVVVGAGGTNNLSGYPVFESSGTSPYTQLYYIMKV